MGTPDHNHLLTFADVDRFEEGRLADAAVNLGMREDQVELLPEGPLEVHQHPGDRWLTDGFKISGRQGKRTIHGATYAVCVIKQTSALCGAGEVFSVPSRAFLRDPADWRSAAGKLERYL